MIRDWTVIAFVAIVAFAPGVVAAQDVTHGKSLFQSQCGACHADTATAGARLGPTLVGVVGRQAGAVARYKYSEANRRSGIIWSTKALDHYLEAPQQVVPGTKMAFDGMAKPADRADVVAYLTTISK